MDVLDLSSIEAILKRRFETQEKKLADIPPPSKLLGAKKAAKRLKDAIKNGERICVVGDYDVDGVVATAIVVEFFRRIDYPLQAIIPNRLLDGYGVSESVLERIDADVVMTVDNGITAVEAAKICKERGIDLIITDHHTPPEVLPDAYAIVDPKLKECAYPFKEICGAQVAWLVLAALKRELGLHIDMREFLDLLAIAIIADIMPLIDINRALVKEGLRLLQTSQRPASIIIRDFLHKSKIYAEDVAFLIAPRINSAGRLEDAKTALEFLTAQTTQEAFLHFEALGELNRRRKLMEAEATQEAIEMAQDFRGRVIVVAKEGWHEGIVGIVASRLVDRFKKPAIVLSIDNKKAKGSARSLGEADIFALINANKAYLTKFGGHKMAAGLEMRLENIDAFRKAINEDAAKLPQSSFVPKEEVLGILPSSCIDFALLELLERFEPYGEANKRPKFLAHEAEVVGVRTFGIEQKHSKIYLKLHPRDVKVHEFVIFRRVIDPGEYTRLTCSFSVVKNEFNNRVSLQLLMHQIYD